MKKIVYGIITLMVVFMLACGHHKTEKAECADSTAVQVEVVDTLAIQ